MTQDLGRLGSREIQKLQMFDFASATPLMYFDYANTTTFETNSSRVFAWGAGSRRIAWDGEKELSLSVETQLFTLEHLAIIAGEEIVEGARDIYRVDTLVVGADNKIELKKTPIGGVGGVAVFPYINGVIDKKQAQSVESISSKVITLASGSTVTSGQEVQVFYQWKSTKSKTVSFTAKGFPKYVKLVGDTLFVDELAGEAEASQIVYYKAKVQPNLSIAMSSQGDPSSITLTFDLFPVSVKGVETLVDIAVYDDEE
ncbi:hypothetical protein [Paenibacillus odorifer]|uniref:hypothetical protein n=1 Tax=Paenibacillus odorifer TaxID=189426 RepID=UPI00096C7329|nr:hypothetical protein [Paenibacillus odorifer]OME41415.1 hypothetical protein BSK58_14880 [Paenibacillus odorifer]